MQEDNFYIDVLAILVQEILEKVRDRFVGDVAAHNNMSANTTIRLDDILKKAILVNNIGKEKGKFSQATTIYTLTYML